VPDAMEAARRALDRARAHRLAEAEDKSMRDLVILVLATLLGAIGVALAVLG
jgi:hypothetical protein